LDVFYGSAVDASYKDIGAIGQARHALEAGLQFISGGEQVFLTADDKNAYGQYGKCSDNEGAEARSS
jgi:hypothetical protein